jgi:predicted RNA binding protein YcfA (HicA-like mRNA interferase family)
MKIPRNVNGTELAKALNKLGYQVVRQTGSHLTATTTQAGEHHVTIPNHRPIKLGTLSGILKAVAKHHGLSLDELLNLLDL